MNAGARLHPRTLASPRRPLLDRVWHAAPVAALWLCAILGAPAPAVAQLSGHVSALVDVLPDVDAAAGAQPASELRARVYMQHRHDLRPGLRWQLAGYVDGLVARRRTGTASRVVSDAIVRPSDAYVEWIGTRFDVRIGASRLVWGRLDEFQPTDVVNPIDLTRFLLEGRSEARLPVALARGRVFVRGDSAIEAVVVPLFRESRFDELAEESSPFNLAGTFGGGCTPLEAVACRLPPLERRQPPAALRNVQGGARFTATSGRVDWAVSGYRGFRTFPVFTAGPSTLVGSFPRFTMIGTDFETARGEWGVRGELAVFVQDQLQALAIAPVAVPARTFDAGLGVDRRAGDVRIAASVMWSHRSAQDVNTTDAGAGRALAIDTNDVMLVAAADRSFAGETRRMRVFAAYDPADATLFARGIAAVGIRDDVWLEASAGVFAGSSSDLLGSLTRRDFLYARVRVYF